jgi:hypothetical protein
MRWWYALLLWLPMLSGVNNARSGGDFMPVFLAGLVFVLIAIGALEAMIFARRMLRRPQRGLPMLNGMSHHAA